MGASWSDAEWIHASWLQSALLPLVTGAVFAFLSGKFFPRYGGLTLFTGFLVSALLMGSYNGIPQTAADELAAVALGAVLIGLLMDLLGAGAMFVLWLGWLPAAAAVVWPLWPIMERQDIVESLWQVSLLGGFIWAVAWLMSLQATRERPGHVYIAYLSLAAGVSLSCWFVAQPVLAQYSGALGASALAALIPVGIAWLPAFRTAAGMAIPSIDHPLRASLSTTLPGAFVTGMALAVGHILGHIPMTSIALLAAIPVVSFFSPTNRKQFGFSVAMGGVVPILLAAAAVYLTAHAVSPDQAVSGG